MSPLKTTDKALYQPWNEDVFQGDVHVRYMTPLQRWMYRTLCQSAFFCETRPYLPDDDNELWMLAGCQDLPQWATNCGPVRRMFTPLVLDGKPLLSRKRIIEDWERVMSSREHLSSIRAEAGRRGGLAKASKTKQTEAKASKGSEVREVKRSEGNGSEGKPTNLPTDAAGGSAGAAPKSTAKSGQEDLWTDLQLTWADNYAEFPEGNLCEDAPEHLPRVGLVDVESIIRTREIPREDLLGIFDKWLDTRYTDGLKSGARINQPLTMFASELLALWIIKKRKNEPSAADIAAEMLETNVA